MKRPIEKSKDKKIPNPTIPAEKFEELVHILLQKAQAEKGKVPTGIKHILNLVAAGAFEFTKFFPSNVARFAKPYLEDPEAYHVWKRFDIPYLKRMLDRLEKAKLIEIAEKDGKQSVVIKQEGRVKILSYALGELIIKKPAVWNGKWWLVSYDLPNEKTYIRNLIRKHLLSWGFFPLHESVYLHAYPCRDEITFLREYLGIGKHVRIFKVDEIENDAVYRKFFEL